ncbi:MAG: SPFH domain-containing protein [Actinomycetota bacterium]
MDGTQAVLVVILVLIVLTAPRAFKTVPGEQRAVIFRLGRFAGVKGPGLVLIIPFIDAVVQVDMTDTQVPVSAQTALTRDGASVTIGLLVTLRVVDPARATLTIGPLEGAVADVAAKALRSTIAASPAEDVASRLDLVSEDVRFRMHEEFREKGVEVSTVEISTVEVARLDRSDPAQS